MKSAIAARDIELGASYRGIPGASRMSDSERFRDVVRQSASTIERRDNLCERGNRGRQMASLRWVAAPARYYAESSLPDCLTRAREHLKRFVIGSRIAGLSMSLDALTFPDWLDCLPYSDGAEVRSCCDRKELTDTGRHIRDAFESLILVYPETGR